MKYEPHVQLAHDLGGCAAAIHALTLREQKSRIYWGAGSRTPKLDGWCPVCGKRVRGTPWAEAVRSLREDHGFR